MSPTPPLNPRTPLALWLSLMSCFVMPAVYFAMAASGSVRGHVVSDDHVPPAPVMVALGIGYAVWVAAFVLSIRSIVVSGMRGIPRAGSIAGLVLTLLSGITALAALYVFVIMHVGAGPHH